MDSKKAVDDQDRNHRNSDDGIVKFIGAVIALAFLMYWTWQYVGPSGKTTDIGTFIGLWLREILLLGTLGLGFFAACSIWLQRVIRKLFWRDGDVPYRAGPDLLS